MSVEAYLDNVDLRGLIIEGEDSFETLNRLLAGMRSASKDHINDLTLESEIGENGVEPEDIEVIREEAMPEFGALCLVAVVPTIHEILGYQTISLNSLTTILNEGIIGTIIQPIRIEEEEKKVDFVIDNKEWNQILDEFKKDGTFSGFFRNPEMLP